VIWIYLKKKRENISSFSEYSSNLFTIIPAKEREFKNPVLIYSAHYDSVISRYSYRTNRILNFTLKVIIFPSFSLILILSCLLLFMGDLPFHSELLSFYIVLIIFASILGIIFTPLYLYMFDQDSELSKGSIDNASGTSILIELAKYYKNHPLQKYDVLILWCGAEEWGIKGSEHFCKKYVSYLNKEYDLNKSVNINIDMVGTHIGLLNNNIFSRKKNKINEHINFSAHLLNISLDNFSQIPNPKSDHNSIRKHFRKSKNKNFQVACFHSIDDRKYIHTKNDTPDKCSIKNLYDCFRLCLLTSLLLDLKKEY